MRPVLIAAFTALACGADLTEDAPLVTAAHENDLGRVEKLLTTGADPRAANAFGMTALVEAAGHGNSAMVEKLLRAGADANAAAQEGVTPLLMAARSGDLATVQSLLKGGAKADAREAWKGQTALMWAAAANHAAIARALIAAGADANSVSTVWPATKPKKEDGNLVSTPPRGGLTPLLFAARQGAMDAAKALVEAGADLNLTEPDGISPVEIALLSGHYDLAAWLLESGADPNVTDRWGRAALYTAIDMFTLEPSVTRPAPKTEDAATGLDVARLALARGAKVDAALVEPIPGRGVSDYADPILREGTTPFIRAAKTGDTASMRLLVEYGANVKAATKQGVTALMAAAGLGWRFGDSEVPEADALAAVKLCIELGLDPNTTDEKGRTALHGAADRGANDIAAFLIGTGAGLDAKDKDGRTALDVAKGDGGRGHPEYPRTVELLTRLAAEAAKGGQ